MEIRTVKLSEIKQNPANPRFIRDENYKKLVQSIKDFPEMRDIREIVVNKDMVILGGNMRYRAMQEAKIQEARVKVVDLSEEKQKEFIIKDNLESGEWEWDKLVDEWEQDKLEEWGLETTKNWTEEVVEDEAPEVSTETAISKLGEVYNLGRHRVMCGDSTKIEDVTRLMDGKKADMVFTDPPYNVAFMSRKDKKHALDYTSKPYEDEKTPAEWDVFMRGFFTSFSNNLKEGGCFYVWGGNRTIVSYYNIEKDFSELLYHQIIVWDKDWSFLNRKDLLAQMELCLYGWKRGKEHYFDRQNYSDIWKVKKENPANMIHSAQKPIELCSRGIKMSSKQDDVVLDLFLGSGSTLIACEQANRICYGMELDPKYVDVIRKRYAKFAYPDRWEKEWESLTSSII